MPQEKDEASRVDHAQEILDVVLVSGNQASKPLKPGKESLYTPAFQRFL
jgi:hypothetical protein